MSPVTSPVEQFRITYPRAESESGIICMIYCADRAGAMALMKEAYQVYMVRGINVLIDEEGMNVILPNKSRVHYGYSQTGEG